MPPWRAETRHPPLEGGMLAAAGLLTPGKVVRPNEMWTGSPAKLRRVMDTEEQTRFARNAMVDRLGSSWRG